MTTQTAKTLTTNFNIEAVKNIVETAKTIREEINGIKAFVREFSMPHKYAKLAPTAHYLYSKIDCLTRGADALGVVDEYDMIDSGVWIDGLSTRPKGGSVSVIPKELEHLGNRHNDDFLDTFKRAVAHIERYARYAVEHDSPKPYGGASPK